MKELVIEELGYESSYQQIAINFARYLNYYFYPWNPDDGTWMDQNNCAFTTQELFDEFSEKYIK